MLVAFLLHGAANSIFTEEKNKVGTETTEEFFKRWIAWGVLFVVLFLGADIPTTSELAVAFAWLIAFFVIFNNGDYVANGIRDLVNQVGESTNAS